MKINILSFDFFTIFKFNSLHLFCTRILGGIFHGYLKIENLRFDRTFSHTHFFSVVLLCFTDILIKIMGNYFYKRVVKNYNIKNQNLFLKSRKYRHSAKTFSSFSRLFIVCLTFLLTDDTVLKKNHFDIMKELHRNDFFSPESILFSQKLESEVLINNLNYFVLSKLKKVGSDTYFKHILLLSGDISLNPGPTKYPCSVCGKGVRTKGVYCTQCGLWVHKKCDKITDIKYRKLAKISNKDYTYTCSVCLAENSQNTCQNLLKNPNEFENISQTSILEVSVDDHTLFDYLPFADESILENVDNKNYEQDVLNKDDCSAEEQMTNDDDLNYKIFTKRGLHIIHININSLLLKIEELRIIASKTNIAIIGITESKLDKTVLNNEIKIPGYNIIRADRNRHGGGVLCYIRDNICFNERENFSNEIENIFLDVLLPKTKPILVGILYRPPDQPGFLYKLSNAINNTTNFDNQEVYILGDLNINLRYTGRRIPNGIKRYREFCTLHGLKQLIESPTRITQNTSTILDHILTNSKDMILEVGTLETGLSDHQLIYCTRKKYKEKTNKKTFIKYRSLKHYTPEILIDKLKNTSFPNYSTYDDVNVGYENLIHKVIEIINEIAPIKEMCIKNNTEEWVDEEIFEAIRIREKKYKHFKRTRLNTDHVNYRKSRNNVTKLIKKKKRDFVKIKLTENIGNSKELWKTLKKLGLPSKKEGQTKICLGKEGNISFDNKTNCETFKDFYANLAADLVKKLPFPTNRFGTNSVKDYYRHLNLENKNFTLKTISEEQILKLLQEINPSKAVGLDNLGGKFLKEGASELARPISQLINLSITSSIFPNQCKIAKLKPLYKKGSSLEPKNYRPISLLPIVSKIFEKIVHDQTREYLDKNDILFKYQSGFRRKHSTDTCLSLLNDKILSGIDQGMLTGMILIDLQKAFDTVDYDIFFTKLHLLGFSQSTILWYKSYLMNRSFLVNVENDISTPGSLMCGVPQGSILGPLIFLIYINDMASAVDCDLLLYADDSCLVSTGQDMKTIEDTLNRNFDSLCDWFVENKLSIHFGEDKTKSIVFGSNKKLKNLNKLGIKRGDVEIKQYSNVTYLGCVLDQNLSGESMVTKVLGKISGRLKFLYRKQSFLSYPLRRMLCNALMQPHFDYACTAWYPNLNKKFKQKIQVSQNKCIRFCLSLGNRDHIGVNEFQKINWLPVRERFEQCMCVGVYKFFNNVSPAYMSDMLKITQTSHNTRRSTLMLKQPSRSKNIGQKALSYLAPKCWNYLPSKIKLSSNANSFKHAIKDDFFDQLCNAENDPFFYPLHCRGRFSILE